MAKEKALSGEELEKALREDRLESQSSIVLTGMIDSAEEEGFLRFTLAGCENWVELPTSIVQQAVVVGRKPCRDHSHAVVELTLKEPKGAAERVLHSLLAQSLARRPAPETDMSGGVRGGGPQSRGVATMRVGGGFGYDAGCSVYPCGTCNNPDGTTSLMYCLDPNQPNDGRCKDWWCWGEHPMWPVGGGGYVGGGFGGYVRR
jgi:hypothetical protein